VSLEAFDGFKPMSDGPHRKVLFVEDDAPIRNVLYVLLAGQGLQAEVAYSGTQALSMIDREEFDAVLLDLRCRNLPAEHVVSRIPEIRPSLVGRVLVITGEVDSPETLKMLETRCLPHVSRERLLQDLWTRLRPLIRMGGSPKPAA
jgi:DNA-binding response OmpR family regulator